MWTLLLLIRSEKPQAEQTHFDSIVHVLSSHLPWLDERSLARRKRVREIETKRRDRERERERTKQNRAAEQLMKQLPPSPRQVFTWNSPPLSLMFLEVEGKGAEAGALYHTQI